jgi:rubredoxin
MQKHPAGRPFQLAGGTPALRYRADLPIRSNFCLFLVIPVRRLGTSFVSGWNSRMIYIWSGSNLINFVAKLPWFEANKPLFVTTLSLFETKLPWFGTELTNSVTKLPLSVAKLTNSVTKLPLSVAKLTNSVTKLPWSETKLINFVTALPLFVPNQGQKIHPIPAGRQFKGRDSALRCPDAAARHPCHFARIVFGIDVSRVKSGWS